MTTIIPVGFSNLHIRWRLSSDPQEMSSAIGFSSGPGRTVEQDAADLSNAMLTSGLSAAANFLSVYTFTGVTVERQTSTGILVASTESATVGTMAGSPLPNNCAHLIDKITNFGGRKQRGRMFWVPCYEPETGIDHQGNMATARQAIIDARFDTYLSSMAALDLDAVLLHSSPADTPTPIVALRLQQQIATQRERMR